VTIKVLLADDHQIIRDGLRSLLTNEPDIEVVGEANDGRAAVEMTQRLKPDIVVMDITMPGLNGIEATRQVYPHRSRESDLPESNDSRHRSRELRAS
jgi:DNA-binding NarL/FixJ family response regulator